MTTHPFACCDRSQSEYAASTDRVRAHALHPRGRMKHWIKTRAPLFAALGVTVGAVAAALSPEIALLQGLWGGLVGGLVGGAGGTVVWKIARR